MAAESEKLLPCPFCGYDAPGYHGLGRGYVVICDICQAEGPVSDVKKEAINLWNHREDTILTAALTLLRRYVHRLPPQKPGSMDGDTQEFLARLHADYYGPEARLVMNVSIAPDAMDLFAPLAPCPECKRPLPVPFADNYQHWEGCSQDVTGKGNAP